MQAPPTVAEVQKRVVAKCTHDSTVMVDSGMDPINCASSNDAIANAINFQAINNVWAGKFAISYLLQP